MQANRERLKGFRSAAAERSQLVVMVLAGAILMAAAFLAGKEYGARSRDGRDASFLAEWNVVPNESMSEGRLRALMLRLSELQSQMLKLNAMGQRVVEKLDVDSEEFDFSEPPGVGGPLPQDSASTHLPVNVNRVMAVLSRDIAHRGVQLKTLDSMLTDVALKRETLPAGFPVKNGRLSSRYGWRTDPFTGRRKFHHGVDLAARRGAKILASASGLVTWAGKRGGYGKMVEITHADGYVTRYGHSARILVKRGQMVRRGQPVAHVGSTGRSTGPHLHYEVLINGKKVDPSKFMQAAAEL